MTPMRYIAGALVALSIATFGFQASAQSATTTGDGTGTTTPPIATTTPPIATTTPPTPVPPMDVKGEWKLDIGPKGHALLRGNIVSISGQVLQVKSWGGVWTVHVNSDAELLPRHGSPANLSDFLPGDYIGISGVVRELEPSTIDAKVVRNRTEARRDSIERRENRDALNARIKEEKEKREALLASVGRIVEGKITALGAGTFTLSVKDKSYDVTTNSSTKFVNEKWRTITFADLAVDHKIRVFGVVSSSTISAEVVRDTSLK